MVSGSDLLSRDVSIQVPSARRGLTTVFGMGTGGSPLLLPPESVECSHIHNCIVTIRNTLRLYQRICDQALDLLVSVSSIHYCTYTPDLSTSSSIRSLNGISILEAGFTLRCLQRLSEPYIATQLCSWRNNWCTIGTSTLVLSY